MFCLEDTSLIVQAYALLSHPETHSGSHEKQTVEEIEISHLIPLDENFVSRVSRHDAFISMGDGGVQGRELVLNVA